MTNPAVAGTIEILATSLPASIGVFALAAVVIVMAGTRLAGLADRIADRTGLGEALTGATLLGGSTSLPGIVASVTAAWQGYPELAMSNAIGGIAAQTAFLGVADFFHRRANLEHAATSVPNILNGLLVIVLLAGLMAASDSPNVTVLSIHPATPLLLLAYLFGLRLAQQSGEMPQWKPKHTPETVEDVPNANSFTEETMTRMWIRFAILATLMAFSGFLIAQSAIAIAGKTGLSESLVGGLFTAVSTSTPELVTTIAAVRRGALTLAVGGILGGNAFDVMFGVAADVAYRAGSVYHAIGQQTRFLLALTVLMTTVLVMGMMVRQKRGVANIGFESALMLGLYLVGLVILTTS